MRAPRDLARDGGGLLRVRPCLRRDRFDKPAVLSRKDRGRHWTRTTLEVTTDPDRAAEAPPLAELANPPRPTTPTGSGSQSGFPRRRGWWGGRFGQSSRGGAAPRAPGRS